MRSGVLALAALVLAACEEGPVAGSEASWTASIGRLVVTSDDAEAVQFVQLDGAGPEDGRMTRVAIDDADIDEAIRLETLGQPPRMESLQVKLPTTGAIDGDATCWLRFEARAAQPQVEVGLARLSVLVQPTAAGLSPFLQRSLYIEPVWTAIDLAFTIPSGLEAGEAEVAFAIGTQLQVLDIGGVSMRCFDDVGIFPKLPETTFNYAGREADAPWRATAESQIERYRKGDLTVEVTDADGEPVPDAEIHIQMIEHAFKFGASIEAKALADGDGQGGDAPTTAAYRKNLDDLFNTVTFENSLSWTAFADEANRGPTEEALAWVRSLGLDLRGRGLASTNLSDLPPALEEKRDDPEAVRQAVRAGITATASALSDQIAAWDVVDRPRGQGELIDLLGRDEFATWFRLAREAAPAASLMLSESDILAGDRMAELATLIGDFLGQDVPIDGIGAHGRFETQPPPIQVLSDRLDQLASFDLPLVITAYDMITSDELLQADFTRDFLTLAFSHPSVEGFVFERFWEDDAGTQHAALYRRDGTIGLIGDVYRDLVLGAWRSDIVALSNAEGALTTRVFQGDYMVSVQQGDRSATATLNIGPDGATVSLKLAAKEDGERAL